MASLILLAVDGVSELAHVSGCGTYRKPFEHAGGFAGLLWGVGWMTFTSGPDGLSLFIMTALWEISVVPSVVLSGTNPPVLSEMRSGSIRSPSCKFSCGA